VPLTPTGLDPVTISRGLLLSQEWGLRPAEVLLREVDAALYAAKDAGRNCVKVARPEEPSADHVPPLREPVRQRR
jgi:GGDEF domain-containing protein